MGWLIAAVAALIIVGTLRIAGAQPTAPAVSIPFDDLRSKPGDDRASLGDDDDDQRDPAEFDRWSGQPPDRPRDDEPPPRADPTCGGRIWIGCVELSLSWQTVELRNRRDDRVVVLVTWRH